MEGDTTHLVGDNPGAARRSTSYTQPFEFEHSSQHYTAGLHRVMLNNKGYIAFDSHSKVIIRVVATLKM